MMNPGDLVPKLSIRAGMIKTTKEEWRISATQYLLKNGLIKI